MQHGVPASRGVRARTRFVLPAQHRRERHLGLHRVFRAPSGTAPAALESACRQPVQAIRTAARGLQTGAGVGSGGRRGTLRPVARMSWSPARGLLRDPRTSGAALWRA